MTLIKQKTKNKIKGINEIALVLTFFMIVYFRALHRNSVAIIFLIIFLFTVVLNKILLTKKRKKKK